MITVYGAVDEWLQGYVRRQPDIMDFVADLAAAAQAGAEIPLSSTYTDKLIIEILVFIG